MPSNDETVLAVPQMQCPSCKFVLETRQDHTFAKFSKAQRAKLLKEERDRSIYSRGGESMSTTGRQEFSEDRPSDDPEIEIMIVSCGNGRCQQYNRFKAVRLPKLQAPSVTINLE